jgi:hypothetical protein
MKKVLNFDEFVNESSQEYRKTSKKYLLDNFYEVPSNDQLYDAKESDFQDLPWYKSIKQAFPDFKLDRVRKDSKGGYNWFFVVPVSGRRGTFDRIFKVYRPLSRYQFSNDLAQIYVNDTNLTYPTEFRVYLNDKESWNQIFKIIYFAMFSGSSDLNSRSVDHIMDLFSRDLEELYKDGDLGIIGVKKDCNPYGGHYDSPMDLILSLPYGIYDEIKKRFIEKVEKDPVTIQYALSQCQLPTDSTTKGFGNSRLYPKDEVLDFYNHLKSEGYVPPKGFEEGAKEVTDLQGSLSDIGL